MANYNLVIGSKFRPFSYDEMIKPVDRLTTEYNKIGDDLSELQTKAGIWEGLANEQSDPETYKRYKAYADELNNAAMDLAINGLNPMSRQNLYMMKARYASDITPIEKAYERREKLAEEQRKLNAQNNWSLRFDNDYSAMSLDSLIKNPGMSYQALNGEAIASRAKEMISGLAKDIRTEPQYKSILNGQYWQSAERAGYTDKEIVALAQNDPDAPEELRALRGIIHNSLKDNPAYNEQWVDQWIGQGAFSGIGGTKYSVMQNRGYLDPEARNRISINNQRLAMDMADRLPQKVEITNDDGKKEIVNYDPVHKSVFRYDTDGKTKIYTPEKDGQISGSSGSLIPEIINGIPTGRYYDTKLKKYINGDGTLAEQGKLPSSETTLKPLFFTAPGSGAGSKVKVTEGRTGTFGAEGILLYDPRRIKYSDLADKSEAKVLIKSYLIKALGLPTTSQISEAQVKAASEYLDITRDRDWFSNNHFAVSIPGIDDQGTIVDVDAYNTAVAGIKNVLHSSPKTTNEIP